MTDTHALCARLTALFSETLNVDVPESDMDLFESGALDSLTFVELLFQLEVAFGITTSVDDLEPENFRTIACIAEFVAARIIAAQEQPQWMAPLKARVG